MKNTNKGGGVGCKGSCVQLVPLAWLDWAGLIVVVVNQCAQSRDHGALTSARWVHLVTTQSLGLETNADLYLYEILMRGGLAFDCARDVVFQPQSAFSFGVVCVWDVLLLLYSLRMAWCDMHRI